MKKGFILLMVISLLVSWGFRANAVQKKPGIRRVVIDAGHGGHDPGTMGKKSKEKEIALSVALKLGKMIKSNFPGVEVIYTRETDIFVEVYRRAQIANEKKADLFISIHCNGTKSSDARGVETWVMGLHKSKENLEVAKKENASILMEDNFSQYDGFDPNSPEANIIFSLYQNVYLDQSLEMATGVQDHFYKNLGLINRGVKQAGFWVLYKTTMPGILVEAGFLSNPSDEEYLLSEKGQQNIASAIFNAFADYKGEKDIFIEPETIKVAQAKPAEQDTQPLSNKKPEISAHQNVEFKGSVPSQKTNPGKDLVTEKPVFRVQVISSPKKLPEHSRQFKGLINLHSYTQKGAYKYTVGNCSTVEEALQLQSEMKKKGFHDAFVVAFYQGQRISVEEAKSMTFSK